MSNTQTVSLQFEKLPPSSDICVPEELRSNASGVVFTGEISDRQRDAALNRAISGTKPLDKDDFSRKIFTISNAADHIENLPMVIYHWITEPYSEVVYISTKGLYPQAEYNMYTAIVKSYSWRGRPIEGRKIPSYYCPKVLFIQVNNVYSPLSDDPRKTSLAILLDLYRLFESPPFLVFYIKSSIPILSGNNIYEFLHENIYKVMESAGLPREEWARIAARLIFVTSDIHDAVNATLNFIAPEP